MAIFFKPGQRMPLHLSTDTNGDPRRVFYFAAPSGRDAMELADLNDSIKRDAADSKNPLGGRDAIKRIFGALQSRLLGWDNCGDFDKDKLPDVVTLAEAQMLVSNLVSGIVTEQDAGN